MTSGLHTTPAILKWCALALLRVNSGDWKHPKFRTPPSILYEQVPIISLAFGSSEPVLSSTQEWPRDRFLQPVARLLVQVHQKVHQRADAMPGRTFRQIRFFLIIPARSGDIQVHPRRISSKLAHKHRSGNCPTITPTRIRDIGDGALVKIAVIVIHRKLPHALPNRRST